MIASRPVLNRRRTLGVMEPVTLAAQLIILPFAELDGIDLGQLKAVEIFLSRTGRDVVPQLRQCLPSVFPPADEPAHALPYWHALCESIEQVELTDRLH